MAIKIFIILGLLLILYSLGSALIFLVKDHGEGDRTVKRLTWRIALSLVLFLALWAAYQMGYIEPTGPRPSPGTSPDSRKPANGRASV
jgi:hypothetical protein